MNGVALHRVVVTGIGIVSPIGIGVADFWTNTLAGRIGVGPLTRFDPSEFNSHVAAQIDTFDPGALLDTKRLRRTDRFSQFTLVAAQLALDDASAVIAGDGNDSGVWMGSALGGLAFAEEQHTAFRERGARAVRPLLAISVFGGAATTNVALAFGLHGPNVANANSCAAGTVAIGEAFRAIARGDVRAALAGGAEAPLSPLVFGAFAVIKAMSTRNDDPVHASRPFDRDRDGFVMSEGAGVLFLERYEDAVARGARLYGEIVGYGLTADAYHMTAPQPEGRGSARAMQQAMREARVGANELELIDAHGSSSPLNDVTETAAIKRAFGEAAYRIPVTGTKGQHGHALGATGAWEAALSLLAIAHKRVPRTVNLDHVDPLCDLDYVREDRALAPRVVLSNSTGFGGINAALVVRAVE
ncbi:MAG: beta-ketoacyl-ACP synthase II [Candidatus Eremiobacteraeota bacterium]|nr:beta-ketoacyl-ACP synthase II [Candidatus Eremiobacteraeota bacterium]